MTALYFLFDALRYRATRRRLVERALRRFISRRRATALARRIP
jgi:hypothetical protein